ncbi:MAG TPA: class I SAM-dependent methyltransferase [Fimbriimonadaceae bacterium]|nr:class I SAM-dependent methyltransferase [Fimbriimonadaceae bacterium]
MTTVSATKPDLNAWIERLFAAEEMSQMGHGQRVEDLNLGMGFTYYALARMVRQQTAVVVGSYRGFVPLVLARALSENVEGGHVIFIDPSLVDDFWADSESVDRHFHSYGQDNIRHYRLTSQEFVKTETFRALRDIGIVFVDSYHTEEQAEFEFRAFLPKLAPEGFFIFHDSIRKRITRIYGPDKAYEHSVVCLMDRLKRDTAFQVMDLPFQDGATLVRQNLAVDPMSKTEGVVVG